MELTKDQLRAIQSKSKLLFVNAGPGSGKTKTLIERIAYLVSTGVEPSKILAITFTNKAAKVMQERLAEKKIRGVTASTMHSLAVRLMTQAGETFSIYDGDDSLAIIKRLAKAKKIVDKNEIYEIVEEIALLKDNQISAISCSSKHREIYLEYENELYTNSAVDFADLINNLVVKTRITLAWSHVLVDEAQDLSNAQIIVVRNLYDNLSKRENATVTLVGDIDQSVYEWRNAKPQLIRNFVEKSAEIIPLGINFRSTRSVVHYSKKLIGNNKNRIDKPLESESKEFGSKPEVQWFYDSVEEAAWIADQCKKYKDVCILYRSNWMSAQVELALTKASLKYTVSDSIQFLDRKEIKDVLSYIRVALNSNDKLSLVRSIQTPKRGIGKKFLDGIKRFEDIIDEPKLSEYVSLIYQLRERRSDAGSGVRGLILRSNYLGYDEPERLRNLDQLCALLNGRTLEEAMFDLTGGAPTDDGDNYSRIHLMTLHSSKGTEYDKVLMIGCEEGITPHINSENIEEERRLFYVGMTRAKKELTMSYTRKRLMFGSYNYQQPSRFFKEIGLA
jgi:superfamily I DNA/RNA helicase